MPSSVVWEDPPSLVAMNAVVEELRSRRGEWARLIDYCVVDLTAGERNQKIVECLRLYPDCEFMWNAKETPRCVIFSLYGRARPLSKEEG